jgi:hypothetical protein
MPIKEDWQDCLPKPVCHRSLPLLDAWHVAGSSSDTPALFICKMGLNCCEQSTTSRSLTHQVWPLAIWPWNFSASGTTLGPEAALPHGCWTQALAEHHPSSTCCCGSCCACGGPHMSPWHGGALKTSDMLQACTEARQGLWMLLPSLCTVTPADP